MADQHTDVAAAIIEITAEEAGVEAAGVTPASRFADDLDIDSLSMVEIVYALQEAFNIDIPDEDVKGLSTVADAVDYVEKAQKA